MSGLWGWISATTTENSGELIRQMGARQRAVSQAAGDRAALAGDDAFAPLSIAESEGIQAAVFGAVQWSDAALAAFAKERGHASAAIKGYLEFGTGLLDRLHGPFALAILAPAKKKALLAIDRIGIRSMAFAHTGDGLIFGTSSDHVTAHPAIQRRVDPQAIFDFLYSHVVSAPRTIYEGVEKLLPGQCLLWEDGRVERRFYWHMPYEEPASGSFAELKEEFMGLLQSAVSELAQEQRTACFLSGGTDSSTVAGMFRRVRGQSVPSYSIGFEAEEFDETEYARIASRHFGTDPHEYYVTPDDVVEALPLIAREYDEPFGNASAVPTYFCAKRAKSDGIVAMLAGDGGDELFGGNFRYGKQMRFEIYKHIPAMLRSGLVEPVLPHLPAAGPIRKLQRYVEQARIPLPDRLESYNLLHQMALDEIFEPAFLRRINQDEPLEMLREVYARASSPSPINRMMHLDLKKTLADNDLRKVNHMCALAGVRVNYPLLNEQIVEFSARLAPDLKVRGSRLRYFFKEALRDFLPPEIITKKKHGFGLPFGLWLTSHAPLQTMAKESLLRLRSRGYLKPSYIDWLLAQHGGAHATYYGVMVWVLMMLEEWLSEHNL